jgi:hypothetical protein
VTITLREAVLLRAVSRFCIRSPKLAEVLSVEDVKQAKAYPQSASKKGLEGWEQVSGFGFAGSTGFGKVNDCGPEHEDEGLGVEVLFPDCAGDSVGSDLTNHREGALGAPTGREVGAHGLDGDCEAS